MKVNFNQVLVNELGEPAILDSVSNKPFDVKTAVRMALNSQFDKDDIVAKSFQGEIIQKINNGAVQFEIDEVARMIDTCKKAWAPVYVIQLTTILNKSK